MPAPVVIQNVLRTPSGWIVDIWNCRGVLKPQRFAGYGNMNDGILAFLEGLTGKEYEWFHCGYYVVPLQKEIIEAVKGAGLEEELSERLERVLNWIVYNCNGGAINWSGFYIVSVDELRAVEKTVTRIYRKVKIQNDEQYELLQYLFAEVIQ